MDSDAPTILPSADVLTSYEHGKFILSNLAAKRARQLRDGAHPLVRCESTHPLSIALAEIAAGKIRPIFAGDAVEPGTDTGSFAVIPDDAIPNELGLLLPALEADDIDDVSLLDDSERDDEIEVEGAEGLANTLGDLIDDPIAADDAVLEPEDDTLSLTDIAEQESAEEDEDAENV